MQPKIQKQIQKVQQQAQSPVQPEADMKLLELEKIKIREFDEVMVGYMKTLQEQNNLYAGLRQQEEQFRVNMNTIRSAVHELKKMRPEELRTISMPWLNGLRHLTPARRDEFIKNNIDMYQKMMIQYKALQGQRINRGDELGESRLRVLKRLWDILIEEHGFKEQELAELVDHSSWGAKQAMVRPKKDLPLPEGV